jgi:toxin ParE1/3/4
VADVRLRGAAAGDLHPILDYSIERFGRTVAEDYLRSFERAFDLLRKHFEAGGLRTDIEPPIRCLTHRSHRIFYHLEGETVWVIRVLHHAMDERSWLPG